MKFEKNLDVIETDVMVIGGGPAGVAAAVSASRNGSKVLLIETKSVLGGMSTSALVGPFMTSFDDEPTEQIVKGVFEELVTKAELRGGAIHPSKIDAGTTYSSYLINSHAHVTPFQSEIIALVMDEMVSNAKVDVLFETMFVDVIHEKGIIKHAVITNKKGLQAVEAKVYIDCTGDADVAYRAKAPTWIGQVGVV